MLEVFSIADPKNQKITTMKTSVFLLILIFPLALYSQTTQEVSGSDEIISDGWYQADERCINENLLDTDNIRQRKWVKVENDIITYIGFSKQKSPSNYFLRNPMLIKVPFVEKKKGKIVAEYVTSTKLRSNSGTSGRNRTCKINIIPNKVVDTKS